MASRGRHGKERRAVELDKFPDGMRVLAVDDNRVCLRVLEILLRECNYEPTVVSDAATALRILREGGEDQFDLVITDVHMPDMDGFQLLELIGLEMDLPVIMLSVDGEKETIIKGIAHGACDYMVKPVNVKKLKNIWQHVVRKNLRVMNHDSSSDSDDADQMEVKPVIVEGERGYAKCKRCSKKMKNDADSSDENKECMGVPTTQKKPRVSWTGELHRRFLEVVDQLGERAYPKTILKMMNVKYLTRANVASHLQKYRIYLKRVNDGPGKHGQSYERWNSPSCMNMNHHRGQPLSALAFRGSDNLLAAPSSVLEPHHVPLQSTNLAMSTVGNGGRTRRNAVPPMPEARRRHASCPPVNSSAKISDHKMLDAFSSSHSDKEHENFLLESLLGASNVVPSSHPVGSSFANMPTSGMLEPVNKFRVQPPELMNPPSAVGAHLYTQLPYHVGNSSYHWNNVASSSYPAPVDGAPLIPSKVNIPYMNQLPSFGASPGQMPIFQNEQQNQIEGIINNTTPVVGFNEDMRALFNTASKTSPAEKTIHNFSPMTQMINGGSTSCQLPNLQTGSFVARPTQMVNGAFPGIQDRSVEPTQMLNGGHASGTLPMQEGPVGQKAPDDYQQPTYTNSCFLDDILASMPNQDFNDDVLFGGER
ncbi:hypothetical protein QYE76_036603 [Lolium multiflorum]|uniref:Two-component response regulator n=1 Tax=Lolium multiflorum TaxID=4521 RepID=A0AAD8R176_LOLMU|nr:hypothetical protein QYE76_036603 [Lolium multiflorum]